MLLPETVREERSAHGRYQARAALAFRGRREALGTLENWAAASTEGGAGITVVRTM